MAIKVIKKNAEKTLVIKTVQKAVCVTKTFYICPVCGEEGFVTEGDAKRCAKVDKMPVLPEQEFAVHAANLAVSNSPPIFPCLKCGHPVVQGNCCQNCGNAGDEDGDVGLEWGEPFEFDFAQFYKS